MNYIPWSRLATARIVFPNKYSDPNGCVNKFGNTFATAMGIPPRKYSLEADRWAVSWSR